MLRAAVARRCARRRGLRFSRCHIVAMSGCASRGRSSRSRARRTSWSSAFRIRSLPKPLHWRRSHQSWLLCSPASMATAGMTPSGWRGSSAAVTASRITPGPLFVSAHRNSRSTHCDAADSGGQRTIICLDAARDAWILSQITSSEPWPLDITWRKSLPSRPRAGLVIRHRYAK